MATLSDARRRAILSARGDQLARRAESADAAPREQLLLCAVGLNLYGLPLSQVSKVRPFERRGAAPTQQPAALGLVVDNGEIRPAFDLAALLGSAEAAKAGGWLVLLAPPQAAALRVDSLPTAVAVEPLEGGEADRARIVQGEHVGKVLVRLSAPDLLMNIDQPHHGAAAP